MIVTNPTTSQLLSYTTLRIEKYYLTILKHNSHS